MNLEVIEDPHNVEFDTVYAIGFAEDANVRHRPTMEDGHVICKKFYENDMFLAVYDGHGGAGACQEVENLLHIALLEEMSKGTDHDIDQCFTNAYKNVDEELNTMGFQYEGCTAVTVLLRNAPSRFEAVVANVGDSRCLIVTENNGFFSSQLTVDHRPNKPKESARVKSEGGFVIFNRVNGILAVSRALGDHGLKPPVSCLPDINHRFIIPNDIAMVLACDGLWDFVTNEAVETIVAECWTNGVNATECAQKLVDTSLENDSTDNISVMVVYMKEHPEKN
ncbi:hypothetical protein PCE1_000747 [Barthelona sp. PCE]